jgi:hypothetical protein
MFEGRNLEIVFYVDGHGIRQALREGAERWT